MMNKKDIVSIILSNYIKDGSVIENNIFFAPINIALLKYWGKENEELITPLTSSVSFSCEKYGSFTKIKQNHEDELIFNNIKLNSHDAKYIKIFDFINMFRQNDDFVKIETYNNIPTGAGLASSASGFAALTKAIVGHLGYKLSSKDLSILARLGSGSASRSIYDKFAIWHKGEDKNGMDSFAEEIPYSDNLDFDISIVLVDENEKKISSREAMKNIKSSLLYDEWIAVSKKYIQPLMNAIKEGDFTTIGEISEKHATLMHSVMLFCNESINYLSYDTFNIISQIKLLRKSGLEIYFTIDAGANVKIIHKKCDKNKIIINNYKII